MKQTMLLTTITDEAGVETFRLIPLTMDSFYIDARFHRGANVLSLVSKEKIDIMQSFPRLDDNGDRLALPGKKGQHEPTRYKQERKLISSNYDYVLSEKADIQKIVDGLTGESNDLDKYFAEVPKEGEEPQKLTILDKDGK